jgi:FkbM family methyltransferase
MSRARVLIDVLIKKAFQVVGLKVMYLTRTLEHTLLGLRHLPIRSVIGVGANSGQFARKIAPVFPEARIYSFEPLSEPFQELERWAHRQPPGRVTAFNVALGDTEGTVEILQCVDFNASSSLLESTDTQKTLYPFTANQVRTPVTLKTLDRYLEDGSILLVPDLLIKMDVQGYEDRVIRGGRAAFRQARACVLEVGLDPLYEGQAGFQELLLLLGELGFRYAGNLEQFCADDGHVVYIDALFVKGPA